MNTDAKPARASASAMASQGKKPLYTHVDAELEVVTPLHISSGEQLTPADFAVGYNILSRVSLSKLAAKLGDNLDALSDPKLVLDDLLTKHKIRTDEVALYHTKMSTRRMPKLGEPVLEFARAGVSKTPYVPGSSLKGALLSGLLWTVNAEARDQQNPQWVSERFKQLLAKCRGPRFTADSELLQELLGKDSQNSLGRILHVPDLAVPSAEDVRVYHAGLFHLNSPNGRGYGWTSQRGDKSPDLKYLAPTFIEALRPGAKIKLRFSFDEFLNRAAATKGSRYSPPHEAVRKQWLTPHSILSGVMDLSFNTLWQEKRYFEQGGEDRLIARYNDLFARCEKLAENEVMLRLGWGLNWHGVTGYLWDDATAKELSLPLPRYRSFPFPKSRRVVFEGENPLGTPGWVILRVTGQTLR